MNPSIIAAELAVDTSQVAAALKLLDDGMAVPFIARYRKEVTGGLDDTQLRRIDERATYLRELQERKKTILAAIDEQGKLTDDLRGLIEACETKARLEDLYLPFKKKRRTKADIAREAGLAPLADTLVDPATKKTPEELAAGFITDGFADEKAVLEGARAIVIEEFSTNADLVGKLRSSVIDSAEMSSHVIEGKESEGAKFRDYFDFKEKLTTLPGHRILALLRGESEGILHLEIDNGDDAPFEKMIADATGLDTASQTPAARWRSKVVHFGWRTKLAVSTGLDARMRLKERADDQALDVFAANLKDVLLAAPAGHRAVLGLDPGYRHGVKCAVVDAAGKVVDTAVVYPHQPQNRWDEAKATLRSLAEKHSVELLAVGNGTASRETEQLSRELAPNGTSTVVVSESGASVYSASEVAAAEFPEMDVSLRGAVSIARRLQDPLAELVKIDPKSIGVGQYQHDVNQAALARTLDGVVEDAVNGVGVDLNTASVPLLTRVAGISETVAKNIVAYREEHGVFRSRAQLHSVPRLGPKAFEQAAGFLRIQGGENPLDASAVHPESYGVVSTIAATTGESVGELIGNTAVLNKLRPQDFAGDGVGVPTIVDIISELDKPGRDPRPEFKTASFTEGVEKISDLTPGMVLEGTVSNVAAFGAFVDIGVHQDGLVHVSAMSHSFVKDPRDIVRSGEVVKVKVLEVDEQRKRISLTLRLDDDPAGKPAGKNAPTRKPSGRGKQQPKKAASQAQGSMAQALKNAGF